MTECNYNNLLQVAPLLLRLAIKVIEAQFVNKTKGHLGMLEHVVKGQVLDAVVGTVDVRVGVFECGLDNKSRGVASLGSGSVVGAGVTALGLDPRNIAVLGNDQYKV